VVHKNRRFSIKTVKSIQELANLLYKYVSLTKCSGFKLPAPSGRTYYFLNDSFSEDGAQEYAVYETSREDPNFAYVESVTISWMTKDEFIKWFQNFDSEEKHDVFSHDYLALDIEVPHKCHLCA
jgi:hypothetical protein